MGDKVNFTNAQVAKMLKDIAAALSIKNASIFQIRAYEGAAEAIEHSTSEIQDLWEEGNLNEIPGIGESLQSHLDELFKTGKVKHWQDLKKDIPEGFFEFLDIPGVGPKTAWKLSELKVKDLHDLKNKLESSFLVKQGFSEKKAANILQSLGTIKEKEAQRMMLPYAFAQAEKVLDYLRKNPQIIQAEALGSLRRMNATIGDLDFAIASNNSKQVSDYIVKMPGIKQVLDKGDTKVSLINNSSLRLDFLIVSPDSFGALLQHFTGSKTHNIHLRTIAERNGLSLSEYGVKRIKNHESRIMGKASETKGGEIIKTKTEEELYNLLGMQTPPPEIREDTGEIEAAQEHKLPKLVELSDIKGDLHLHDNYNIEPSHDLGVSSLEDLTKEALKLNYQYIGIADHSPSVSNHNKKEIIQLIIDHNQFIDKNSSSGKSVRVLKLLEVDIQPDGNLSVPDEGLAELDFAIASIHSEHRMLKDEMTKRILKALQNPYVKVLGHPTGRLLNKRDAIDADWEEIFKFAAKNNKAMEINSYPDRLDLPDTLVKMAKSLGVKFVINTDSHIASDMANIRFGVAVARRGWLTIEDVINSWDWTKFANWFKIK